MGLIKGTSVTLYDLVQTGEDGFHAPVYEETAVTVENVLICPLATEGITTDAQLLGRVMEYELCIPKGDPHIWEDREVAFFGQRWRTVGFVRQWMPENTPGDWDRIVKVVCHG